MAFVFVFDDGYDDGCGGLVDDISVSVCDCVCVFPQDAKHGVDRKASRRKVDSCIPTRRCQAACSCA